MCSDIHPWGDWSRAIWIQHFSQIAADSVGGAKTGPLRTVVVELESLPDEVHSRQGRQTLLLGHGRVLFTILTLHEQANCSRFRKHFDSLYLRRLRSAGYWHRANGWNQLSRRDAVVNKAKDCSIHWRRKGFGCRELLCSGSWRALINWWSWLLWLSVQQKIAEETVGE